MRIFPEMWASTLWPFSSSTRNIAFGRGSMTTPSSKIASSFGFGRGSSLDQGWTNALLRTCYELGTENERREKRSRTGTVRPGVPGPRDNYSAELPHRIRANWITFPWKFRRFGGHIRRIRHSSIVNRRPCRANRAPSTNQSMASFAVHRRRVEP